MLRFCPHLPLLTASFLALLSSFAAAQHTFRVAANPTGRRQSNATVAHARSISPDGRWLAFASNDLTHVGVFLRDLQTGELFPVSVGLQGDLRGGFMPTVSADGSKVAFLSSDGELVANDTNQNTDVFVWTRATGAVTRVNVDTNGNPSAGLAHSAVISRDGSTVAFSSYASDLVPGDTNYELDFFVHQLAAGLTVRVSVDSNGAQGYVICNTYHWSCNARPAVDISDDGRVVAFSTRMDNLVPQDPYGPDVFVHDWFTGATERISESYVGATLTGWSMEPSLSGDGRYVAFQSGADIVPGVGPGVFLRDRATGTSLVVGVDSAGNHVDGMQPTLSQDGEHLAFWTFDDALVLDDQDGEPDLFVQRIGSTELQLVSRGAGGSNLSSGQLGLGWFTGPSHGVTNDGRVMFPAAASAIVGEPSSPQTPFTVVLHDPAMRTNAVSDYCTAKTNTLGCVPRMTVCGAPSMSAGQRFALIAENVRSHKTGFLMWARSALAAPFDGGTMCIGTPRRRTAAQDSGGASTANNCTGAYSFWFDPAYVTSMGLAPGDVVYAQYYSRDPWNLWPSNVGLTNAIRFVVLP